MVATYVPSSMREEERKSMAGYGGGGVSRGGAGSGGITGTYTSTGVTGAGQSNDPLGLGIPLYSYPEWAATYVTNMTQIGYNEIDAREALNYQMKKDDADRAYNYWAAQKGYETAIKAAEIASSKSAEAAAIGAEAVKYNADRDLEAALAAAESARYAADQALKAAQIDADTRLKIAAGELRLNAQRAAAEEMGAPSNWRKQIGFLRGMGMTEADITPQAIQQTGEMLGPGPATTAPATVAPRAVVGEAGPEVATATAGGVTVKPLKPEQAWWLRSLGVPQMARGGTVTTYNRADFAPPGQAIGETFYDPFKEERRRAYEQAYGTPIIGLPSTAAPVRRTGVTIPTRTKVIPGTGGAAPGAVGGGTTAAGGTTAPSTLGEPPYINMLRTGQYVPLWEAWGGPRTNPDVGMNTPIKMPHEINYGDFLRLTPTEQQMAFADWESLGMAPDTALEIMRRSAMRGSAQAVTGYG